MATSVNHNKNNSIITRYIDMQKSVKDELLALLIGAHPDAIVVNIACKCTQRSQRIAHTNTWYDVIYGNGGAIADTESDDANHHIVYADSDSLEWLSNIVGSSAVILLDGVAPTLTSTSISALFTALEERFCHLYILMDVCTLKGAKALNRQEKKAMSPTTYHGIDSPIIPINNTNITYITEHSMMPQYLIDTLPRGCRWHFSTFFHSKIKSMHRLYEYKK